MKFSLAEVLTVTHGYLLVEFNYLIDMLNYLTEDDLFTHQLPRAAAWAGPQILNQYPELKTVNFDNVNFSEGAPAVERWLQTAIHIYGNEFELVPFGGWVHKGPITEFIEKMEE